MPYIPLDTPSDFRYLAYGVISILLGMIALFASFLVTIATIYVLGILLLLGGIFQLMDTFYRKSEVVHPDRIVAGMIYLIVGGLLLTDPVRGAIGITLILALFFIVAGSMRLYQGYNMTGRGSTYLLISGCISIIFAAVILFYWPTSGTWLLGILIGLELLLSGVSSVLFSLQDLTSQAE